MTVRYGRRRILTDVCLALRRREVTALIGANGSGKTTLLRVVMGLLAPAAGRVVPAGPEPARRGYVPQVDRSSPLFPVSALEVVLMGLTPRMGPTGRMGREALAAARRALAELEAEPLASRPYADLSGGERQRVLLARGIVGRPDLLLLDEPVRGLDLAAATALVARLRGFARDSGMAVVMASHRLDLVANHADCVALFHEGRVRAGPTEQIMRDDVLSEFHGTPVHVRNVDGHRIVLPGPAT